MTHIIVL